MGIEKLKENTATAIMKKDPTDALDKYYTEELIIALSGQLGTNLKQVSKEIKDILKNQYGYDCEEIKLSKFLFCDSTNIPAEEYERIIAGMDIGDSLRKERGNNILASRAISEILNSRTLETDMDKLDNKDFRSRRKCFIINSLKHPDELLSFKKVYGKSFFLLGVFSSEEQRIKNLRSSIDSEHGTKIKELLERDNDSNLNNGQKQRDVFVKSDYFIRDSNDSENLSSKIQRFIDLIFDCGVNTPTIEENAMYQATAAAANSACLSRQVGACITDKIGQIIALGWNDVPQVGGGVYNCRCDLDERCYKWQECTNSTRKENMIKKIVEELEKKQLISTKKEKGSIVSNVEMVKTILKKNGIKDLIEFGRSVHAEMHAIIIGSQRTGDKMLEGKLFCTTYPCHNCARHIIMAGIKEVYYIEPYSKSLCLELHKDSISENENEDNKVKILMFEGVAPKSFIKFYQLISDDRKEKVKGQDKKCLKPKHPMHLESLPEKERHYLEAIKDILDI